jgi:hypothetical protein
VLEDRSHETGFPFPHSTALAAPEWSLDAFPWLDWTVARAVRYHAAPHPRPTAMNKWRIVILGFGTARQRNGP